MSRSTDLQVANKVMGLGKLHLHEMSEDLPNYSTDIGAAWSVLDAMVFRFGTAEIRLDMEDYGRGIFTHAGAERAVWVTIGEHTVFGPVAWAVCEAALNAVASAAATA